MKKLASWTSAIPYVRLVIINRNINSFFPVYPFSAMFARVPKLRNMQSCKFDLFLRIWYFQLSLGFRQKFNRVELIHDFRVNLWVKNITLSIT